MSWMMVLWLSAGSSSPKMRPYFCVYCTPPIVGVVVLSMTIFVIRAAAGVVNDSDPAAMTPASDVSNFGTMRALMRNPPADILVGMRCSGLLPAHAGPQPGHAQHSGECGQQQRR